MRMIESHVKTLEKQRRRSTSEEKDKDVWQWSLVALLGPIVIFASPNHLDTATYVVMGTLILGKKVWS